MDEKKREAISSAIEMLENPVRLIDQTGMVIYMNTIMKETFGDLVGHSANFIFSGENEDIYQKNALPKQDVPAYREATVADVVYSVRSVPVTLTSGEDYLLELFEDISEKKHLQEQQIGSLSKVKRETTIAKHIQESILPLDDEYWNSMGINSLYLPADDIGGDVFDILRVSEDETLLYIADVSGHGIQASLLTMFISEKVRAKAGAARRGLDHLMSELLSGFISLDIDAAIYVTLLACMYNRRSRELSIANAGHNCMPLIIRQGGRLEEIHVRGMPLTKISEADSYEEEIIHVRPGDRIILYTDGIIEEYSKTKKRIFGSEGLRKVATDYHNLDGKSLARRIIEESEKYMMLNAHDDRTIVIAEML